MLTLDILICTLNTRIVRIPDLLMPEKKGVNYIVSFQYTKDDYLKMIPESLEQRSDVMLVKLRGEGLSANCNYALSHATADLVYLIDDDTRFLPDTVDTILETFEKDEKLDIAVFKTQSYAGKDVRQYESSARVLDSFSDFLYVLTDDMVCRRARMVDHGLWFDARFGLGSHYLSCYEVQILLADAHQHHFYIKYFPQPIIQTSAIFLPRLIFVDAKVQRSFGALLYYYYGNMAFLKAFGFAFHAMRRKMAHFLPLFKHFMEGIFYLRGTRNRDMA